MTVLYVLSLLACLAGAHAILQPRPEEDSASSGSASGGLTTAEQPSGSGSLPSLWPDGAPEEACNDLRPQSPYNDSSLPSPFMIDLSSFISSDNNKYSFMYVPEETYTVIYQMNPLRAINSSIEGVRGFLIQSRKANFSELVGAFEDPSTNNPNARLSSCSPPESGVTHNNSNFDVFTEQFSFNWTAPPVGTGTVTFYYTTVLEPELFWVAESSVNIEEACVDGALRLQNSNIASQRQGTLEICYDATYGSICDDTWDNQDASVVCANLGFSRSGALTVKWSNYFNPESTMMILNEVDCNGMEVNLLDCSTDINSQQPKDCRGGPAAIVCQDLSTNTIDCTDGNVRLADLVDMGSTRYGRLEICLNNAWGTVCSNHFGTADATVVCRQLGWYSSEAGAEALMSGISPGTGPIFLEGLRCLSNEERLLDCPAFYPPGVHNCQHSQDVGVLCNDVNECNSPLTCIGNNTVCVNTFGSYECNCELGYTNPTEGENCIDLDECMDNNGGCVDICVNTDGSYFCECSVESGLVLAADNHNCSVPSACTPGDIRLVGGTDEKSGRVEVCLDGFDRFGTVCDDQWDELDARVVCRQLGFSDEGAIPVHKAFFNQSGELVILLDDVSCTGNEDSLVNCSSLRANTSDIDCDHSEDAGVICEASCIEGSVRLLIGEGDDYYYGITSYDHLELTNKDGLTAGRVEVCVNGTYGTVCGTTWESSGASVVCRQLGFSPYGAIALNQGTFSEIGLPIVLQDLDCNGTEPSLLDCYTNDDADCKDFLDAGVICQAIPVEMADCNDGDLRLVDRSDENSTISGRLEICINNAWGTVCDNGFGRTEAAVACAQLGGYSRESARSIRSTFGAGSEPIFIDQLDCTGNESTLLDCTLRSPLGLHSCDHSRDVGIECTDIDECAENISGCAATCNNTIGGFECGCEDGFVLSGTFNCIDIDECNDTSTYECDEDAICVNTEGNYTCQCREGYTGDGTTCTDIDECAQNISGCAATCNNTIGGFECGCEDGFVLNGTFNCIDIDECNDTSTYECNEDAVCVNTEGNYTCQCREGYTGDGNTCTVVDACLIPEVHGCDLINGGCRHVDGDPTKHDCFCNPGYDMELDNRCSCPEGRLHLVSETSEPEGRVEICMNNTYGTICDDFWDELDAQVVCNELGYSGQFAVAVPGGVFTNGSGPIYLDNVECDGTESSLIDCGLNELGSHACDHSEDAGVKCQSTNECESGSIRVVLREGEAFGLEYDRFFYFEDEPIRGRVEICENGRYHTICSDSWNNNHASVVCNAIGFSRYGAIAVNNGLFSQNNETIRLTSRFECSGSEDRLENCPRSETDDTCQRSDAGVICQVPTTRSENCIDGKTRLVDGNTLLDGTVLVCINKAWGTVCDNRFSQRDAEVVCRSNTLGLKFNGTVVHRGEGTEQPYSPVFLDELGCSGEESSLLQCNTFSPALGIHSCSSAENNVRITCLDYNECSVRNGECEHTCINRIPDEGDIRGHYCLCDFGFTLDSDRRGCTDINECENDTICHSEANCTNTDGSYVCVCNPGYSGDGVEMCTPTCLEGSVQLNSNDSTFQVNSAASDVPPIGVGRVEICIDHRFGTVCDEDWGYQDASVVCRQLGFSPYGAISLGMGAFGEGVLPTLLSRVSCIGDENALLDCSHDSAFTCGTYHDAAVVCQDLSTEIGNCTTGGIRLAQNTTTDAYVEGRVEVCINNAWGTLCRDRYFDQVDAAVICSMFGEFSDAETIDSIGEGSGPIFIQRLEDCSNEDRNLLECQMSSPLGLVDRDICTHADDVSIRCIDINECENNNGGCMHRCINTPGSFRCECDFGFIPSDGGKVCQDICVGIPEISLIEEPGITVTDTVAQKGRVEVCFNGTQGGICGDKGHEWSNKDAAVACRQLGYNPNGATAISGSFFALNNLDTVITRVNCIGNENSLSKCEYFANDTTVDICSQNAGVVCQKNSTIKANCSDGDIRLMNGDSEGNFTGRVEICINNVWGTVCDSGFDSNEAKVICRQLNYSSIGSVVFRNARYGQGTGPIFVEVSGRQCAGSESNLLDCELRPLGLPSTECLSHSSDVAVSCSECEPGQDSCGVDKFCVGTEQGYRCQSTSGENCTIECPEGFRKSCEQDFISCQDIDECQEGLVQCDSNATCINKAGSSECRCNNGYEGDGTTCSDINECETGRHTCNPLYHDCENFAGGFECVCQFGYIMEGFNCRCKDGELRLMNGSSPSIDRSKGRVEICYKNIYGTICDDFWDTPDAEVVCKVLGFNGNAVALKANITAYGRTHSFGPGLGSILLDDVVCSGQETTLLQCPSKPINNSNCAHSEDAAVMCDSGCFNGSVRLLPEDNDFDFYTNINNPQLYPEYFFIKEEVRLGHVEVCINGSYGTICDDSWDNQDASVVCRQLGFSPYGAIGGSASFSEGLLPLFLSSVGCQGTESDVVSCPYDRPIRCSQYDDADVICQAPDTMRGNCVDGEMRLIKDGEVSSFEGRIEVCLNDAWGSVCWDFFDELEVKVVCNYFNFPEDGAHQVRNTFDSGTGPIFLSELDCTGTESSLLDCNTFATATGIHSCSHSMDAGVYCEALCDEVTDGSEFSDYFGVVTWPGKTRGGTTVNMTCPEQCSNGSSGMSFAFKECDGNGMWLESNYNQCPTVRTCELLSTMITNITEENAEIAVERLTQTISTYQDFDQNRLVTNAIAQTISSVSTLQNITETLADDVVNLLDPLLLWPETALADDSPAIVETFEEMLANLIQQGSFTSHSSTSSNVAFVGRKSDSASLRSSGADIFSFAVPPDGSGGNIDVAPPSSSPTASISLLPGTFNQVPNGDVGLAYTAYRNSSLFPLKMDGARHPSFKILSPVIGATVVNTPISSGASVNITLTMHSTTYEAPSCQYWDTTIDDWKGDGCELTSISSDKTTIICSCNHLTNFGVIANANPQTCDPTHEPNALFTECIPIVPNVRVELNSQITQTGAYEEDNDVYKVGYGYEFGISCLTDSVFSTAWYIGNTMIPEVTMMQTDEPDYSQISGDRGGQLYAFRYSQNEVVLRTLRFPSSSEFVGIQDAAKGTYTCRAMNFGEINSTDIEIEPTAWPTSASVYARFSETSPPIASRTPDSEFLSAYVGSLIVKDINQNQPNSRVTAKCTSVPRPPTNPERYGCTVTADSQYESIVRDTIMRVTGNFKTSLDGFCDYGLLVETPHGFYTVTESKVGDEAVEQECYYNYTKEAGPDGRAMSKCIGPEEWEIDGEECITRITALFRNISMISIDADNVGDVMRDLNDVTSQATDPIDQTADNLNIIASVTIDAASLLETDEFFADKSLVNDTSGVVGGVTVWPPEVLERDSSNIVESFEALSINLVNQSAFTNATLPAENLISLGIRLAFTDLQDGLTLSLSSIVSSFVNVTLEDFYMMQIGENASNITSQEALEETMLDEIVDQFPPNVEVQLPPEAFESATETMTEAGIFFTFYNVSTLFPVLGGLDEEGFIVATPVVGVSIADANVTNLSVPVIITLPATEMGFSFDNKTICVSWEFNATEDGRGNWTEFGCNLTYIDEENETFTCECDHLTNFAILVDIKSRVDDAPTKNLVLSVISIVGAVLSMIGLSLVIITWLASEKLRKSDLTKFHIQLSIAMILMLLIFLIGVDRKEENIACIFMSCLIQYFTLASVFWMGAEAVVMFVKFVFVFQEITLTFLVTISLTCWGAPVLFVVAALGANFGVGGDALVFRNTDGVLTTCFISDLWIFLGTFLIPIIVIIIFNVVMFVIAITITIKSYIKRKATGNRRSKMLLKLMFGIAGLSFMFGLTWLFALFTVREASLVFQIFFTIFNAFQGFYFFVFLVVAKKEGMEFWRDVLRKSFSKGRSRLYSSSSRFRSNHKDSSTLQTGLRSESLKPEVFSPSSTLDKSFIEFSQPKSKHIQQMKTQSEAAPRDPIDGKFFMMESMSEGTTVDWDTAVQNGGGKMEKEDDEVVVIENVIAVSNPVYSAVINFKDPVDTEDESEDETTSV